LHDSFGEELFPHAQSEPPKPQLLLLNTAAQCKQILLLVFCLPLPKSAWLHHPSEAGPCVSVAGQKTGASVL